MKSRGNSGFRLADYKLAEDERKEEKEVREDLDRNGCVEEKNISINTLGICGTPKFYSHDQFAFLLKIFPSKIRHYPHHPRLLSVQLKGIAT